MDDPVVSVAPGARLFRVVRQRRPYLYPAGPADDLLAEAVFRLMAIPDAAISDVARGVRRYRVVPAE